MAVDRLDIPADGLEAKRGVFALRLRCHGVEGDVVGVVKQDEVVELLVAGEGHRLHGDTLLHATVAREADHMVIEKRVLGRVETRGRHLAGERHTDGVADALTQRTGGRLDAGSLTELRMARGDAVQRAELAHLLERHVVPTQVQPSVEEHRSVAGREDKPVAVDPLRTFRVVHQSVAEKHGADLRRPERKPEMSGGAGVDRVDRETAGLIGGFAEEERLQGHAEKLFRSTDRRRIGKA